jgi:dTDP-4-dehydrorhamnose 3,5-epimerase
VIFRPTALPGVIVIEPERIVDERGHFARNYSQREFSANGIRTEFALTASSFNDRAGTLRGLHFQAPPFAEAKLVSCIAGCAFDVVVDLRRDSKSYGRWTSVELSPDDGTLVFIPEGCAHGFQTLTPGTVIHYQLSTEYRAELSRGIRWNDPALDIDWPYPEPTAISARDAALPWIKDEIRARPRPAASHAS